MQHPQDHANSKKDLDISRLKKLKNSFIQKFLASTSKYKPLIIIIIFCILLSVIHLQSFDAQKFICYYMGYFFIFLSLFKFFDLKGFVDSFSGYDLITEQIRAYGYFYPSLEFLLGAAYLTQNNLFAVNLITLIIMAISGAGVFKSILSGQKINCACLGTVLNVPLSTVSILENVGMGAMAAYKLFFS